MKKKNLIDKFFYEIRRLIFMFGHDNLIFKCINMPKNQHFNNICTDLKLKKLTKGVIFLQIIHINKI